MREIPLGLTLFLHSVPIIKNIIYHPSDPSRLSYYILEILNLGKKDEQEITLLEFTWMTRISRMVREKEGGVFALYRHSSFPTSDALLTLLVCAFRQLSYLSTRKFLLFDGGSIV